MFHANLKIKRFKKVKKKSVSEAPVQKDDEFLGNLLRRSGALSPGKVVRPRISVTGEPIDFDEEELNRKQLMRALFSFPLINLQHLNCCFYLTAIWYDRRYEIIIRPTNFGDHNSKWLKYKEIDAVLRCSLWVFDFRFHTMQFCQFENLGLANLES